MMSSTLSTQRSYRIESIDLLRGIVMIVMALDHTRELIHRGALLADPLNLETTTPILFVTRWVTHFCAPIFVFLSGVSIFLQSRRKTPAELSSFIISRGLWLMIVEILIVTPAITFDIHFGFVFLQVIWAIGISMVILGLLIRLVSFYAILAIGLTIVLGHNLLDYWEATHSPPYSIGYSLLHIQGMYPFGQHLVRVLYPFLPWTGVMLLGYCFGKWYVSRPEASHRVALRTGISVIVLFIALRLLDRYGDPLHWSMQRSGLYTLFSFVNTQKYPPSLLYLCMTIGPALVFLGLSGSASGRLSRIVTVYGKVPFFYYLAHFYLIHFISAILYLSRGHSVTEGAAGMPGLPFKFLVVGEGYTLAVVYLVWALVVISLYPACKWFAAYKRRHSAKWLSYL